MAELYTEFIGNYSKALMCIRELESANPEYVKFMTASSRSKDTNRQSLKDSLVYPVQRTTRYHLFLAGNTRLIVDLLKHTSSEHPDYFNLQVALQTVLDFVDSINHNKKMEEERAKLARILSRTINCPNGLMDAALSLVCISDALCAVTRKSLILILFTDSLVILMHEKKNKRFTALMADQPYTFVRKLLLEETNITHSEKLLTFTKSIAPKIEKTLSTPSITIVKSQSSTDLRSLEAEPGKISRANSDRASMRTSRGGPTRSRKAKLMQILGSDSYKAPTEEMVQPEVLDFLIAAEGWYPPEAVVPVLGGGSLAEGVADLGADSFVVLFHEGLNEFVDSYEKAQTKCRLSAKVQE